MRTLFLVCTVGVSGIPSCEEDEGVAGYYNFLVSLNRAVDTDDIGMMVNAEIARSVLSCFHKNVDIENVHDFVITAYLPDGRLLDENKRCSTGLVAHVKFIGMVDSTELGFEVEEICLYN